MHTTISDGVWTPEALLRYVEDAALERFSITDHDTMDVYPLPAGLAERCVPGMEVDSKCAGATTHLLVYGIDSPHAPLLEFLRAQRAARRVRMEEMIASLQRRGIAVAMADVEEQAGAAASLGRPHLARALVKLGAVGTVQEAFDRYIADGQANYVELDRLEAPNAIRLAHESGAIVSVAHPCRLREPAMLDTLREAGVDGVEVVHPSADAVARERLEAYARTYGLLVTGGSDFHAPTPGYAPGIELAAEDVQRLWDAAKQRA